ncbi:hypothetical protein ACLI1A_09390 [Flavobacterium sp. RHBU_3]|uniref:hypothetical protein n=1 Tax=Flavobacterium sp. RHBU_3 TaxID=3391184 RepID=UPI003984CA42
MFTNEHRKNIEEQQKVQDKKPSYAFETEKYDMSKINFDKIHQLWAQDIDRQLNIEPEVAMVLVTLCPSSTDRIVDNIYDYSIIKGKEFMGTSIDHLFFNYISSGTDYNYDFIKSILLIKSPSSINIKSIKDAINLNL